MHVFVVSSGRVDLAPAALLDAVLASGREFGLDPDTAWTAVSDAGALGAAGVHHASDRCGPRRYLHRTDCTLTFFDGLPVDARGRTAGHDAEQLDRRWEALSGALEGAFTAVRAELREGRVEVVLDAMALCPVYAARAGSGLLLSNSSGILARLIGLDQPDPLGVSSFLGLGWAASDRVLNRGISTLAGGARHTIEGGTVRTERSFGPASVPAQREAMDVEQVARHLTALTRNAVRWHERVGCALTAGRDTRVLAALLHAAKESARYFTGGPPGHPDVVIAQELAASHGLEHEVVSRDPAQAEIDWTDVAARFVAQNDGLSGLLQLPDYVEAAVEGPTVGVKLGGVGGEIGRAGTGHLTSVATNVPLLRRSVPAQRALLAMKVRNDGGLMTPAAVHELRRYLNSFIDERVEEGWAPWQLQEAFYAFERVGRWGATGTRRVAGTDDGLSPLATRAFIDYCFSVSSSERYIEAPHHRLLATLTPSLLEHRFEDPFPPQHRAAAPLLATRELAQVANGYLRHRLGRRAPARSDETPDARPEPQYPFQHAWTEQRLELIGDLFSDESSPLWELISRPGVLKLLAGTEAERARNQEALLRAVTVAWHFHGPRPRERERSGASAAVGGSGD